MKDNLDMRWYAASSMLLSIRSIFEAADQERGRSVRSTAPPPVVKASFLINVMNIVKRFFYAACLFDKYAANGQSCANHDT